MIHILLFIIVVSQIHAKIMDCKGDLHTTDTNKHLFYCTKFAVGLGKAFKSSYSVRFPHGNPRNKVINGLPDDYSNEETYKLAK